MTNTYIYKFLEEKNLLESEMPIDGHIGLTYEMLAEFITNQPTAIQDKIKSMLTRIDFANGDYKHYLHFLGTTMLKSIGY